MNHSQDTNTPKRPKPDSIGTLLRAATQALAPISDSPRLDAETLLAHVLEKERSYLHAWPEHTPDQAQGIAFEQYLARRIQGEPIAYLLGEREFWSLAVGVGPGVLIPRPETELLIEWALELLPAHRPARIADLGTGSGAIALALASERPHWQLLATDASAQALDRARDNAQRLALNNLTFRQGDWCEALGTERYDLILSNPPYIASDDPHLQQGDLRYEPPQALSSGADGLDALRRIIASATGHLEENACLLLEHGYDQAETVANLLKKQGFIDISQRRDLAGVVRASLGRQATGRK